MESATENLELFNRIPEDAAREALLRCCGSERWAESMTAARPFASEAALFEAALRIWLGLSERDWLEAFSRHPRIGSAKDVAAKEGAERRWSSGEQAGAACEPGEVLAELAEKNREYAQKFGFIYIVCATGKSGIEMLEMLKERLENDRGAEIGIAAAEQAKITRLRLEKLLAESSAFAP